MYLDESNKSMQRPLKVSSSLDRNSLVQNRTWKIELNHDPTRQPERLIDDGLDSILLLKK
jgi:hypothetical protein